MRFLLFISTILIFFNSAHSSEVSIESDAQYKKSDGEDFVSLKSGEKFELNKGETAFILPSEGIPTILHSPSSSGSKIIISKTFLEKGGISLLQPYLDNATNEIVEGLRTVDSLILKREYNRALQVIQSLKLKYDNNSQILFQSGTVYYLLNEKASAIQDLEKGLRINPKNDDAKRLLSKLKEKV